MKISVLLLMIGTFWVYETNNDVNLRRGPDNQKRVIRTVPKGKTLQVLEKTNQWWWKVEYEGKKGYIASDFISRSYPKTTFLLVKTYPYESLFAFIVLNIMGILLFRKRKS